MRLTKYIAALVIAFASLSGCDSEMDRINTNPLALTQLSDEYLFTSAVRETFGSYTHIRSFELRIMSQYAHVFVFNNELRETDKYNDFHVQDLYEEIFSERYTGPIKYINEVLRLTQEGTYKNEVRNALATVVAMISYAKVTDSWGDVPYTEGGKGQLGILAPKYDTQEFIYKDMMEKLKNSIQILKTAKAADAYPGADPVYNNDLNKWLRFANSFRLRLAMRARFADPEGSKKVISECLSEPLIEDNSQNFTLSHINSDNSELYNPWYTIGVYYQPKMSEKFVKWLTSNNDPRLQLFVKPNANGTYTGIPNGISDMAINLFDWESYSAPTPLWFKKDNPQVLMCASEVYFLRAEAALFNLGGTDANSLYREGIRKAMQQWSIPTETITNYLTKTAQTTLSGGTEHQFEQIGDQMWIAFAPNFSEAWSNCRRTAYPNIPQRTGDVLSKGATNGYLPKRFKYTTNEYSRNLDNVNKAITHQGVDKIDTPVWWDKKD